MTLFTIDIPKGEGFVRIWPAGSAPTAIKVTISFAEPYEAADGSLEVPEDRKVVRTMTIDKTRTIKFSAAGAVGAEDQEDRQSQSDEKVEEESTAEKEIPSSIRTRGTSTGQGSRTRSERTSTPTRRL